MSLPVILIFDVGKTNKKVVLFDRQYKLVYEKSHPMNETKDEDGFPCEDIRLLTDWVKKSLRNIEADKRFIITAINVSAYGASFVHLDYKKQPFLPLYNYLKPYDPALQQEFYSQYGGEEHLAKETASPVLGNLNSGMQLYWLKHKKPEVYSQIWCSLHLPQYIAYVLCGSVYSDITSIGCHTGLWNFEKQDYHTWVYKEGIDKKLAPIISSSEIAGSTDNQIPVGAGLHDSSAALIPYFMEYREPFVLLSTGTWSISLNPFNDSLLTNEELKQDCLIYLSYGSSSVKAARLFAGYEHEYQTKRLAAHYKVLPQYFNAVLYDAFLCKQLRKNQLEQTEIHTTDALTGQSFFGKRNLYDFETPEEAYHQLMLDIMEQQVTSTKLIIRNAPVKKIFVDGGFSKNDVFMNLLASAFPDIEVYSAQVAQASALGAAIAIRKAWNDNMLPPGIVSITHFKPVEEIMI